MISKVTNFNFKSSKKTLINRAMRQKQYSAFASNEKFL